MSDPLATIPDMFDATPPLPTSDGPEADVRAEDLADPVAAVVGVELSRRFVRLCLSWAEPMVADLASQESMLRKPGGTELVERLLAQRLYRRIEPQVFGMLRVCVPLEHAEFALSRVEEMLRAQFGEVVRTAASYLLSHDRDVAIQMVAVATTMAGREVSAAASAIVADTHRAGGEP